MGISMGLGFGLESYEKCFPRKHRWIFNIPDVSADGANSLPPSKAARPNLAFKEMEVQHLNETIYFPSKPDWKPITLTLYDLSTNSNPIFEWLRTLYDPESGSWTAPASSRFITEGNLTLYSGCGDILQTWKFENVWPQQIDFHDLDMGNAEITMVDVTLRYARAYIT